MPEQNKMKREIKFRAWNEFDRRMNVDICIGDKLHYEYDAFMQYTGFKDINENEIYEGDIVNAKAEKRYSENSCIGEIIYSDDVAYQVVDKGNSCGLSLAWGGWESFEIIGNIYQNPELLN